jgi:hypothetical protein
MGQNAGFAAGHLLSDSLLVFLTNEAGLGIKAKRHGLLFCCILKDAKRFHLRAEISNAHQHILPSHRLPPELYRKG